MSTEWFVDDGSGLLTQTDEFGGVLTVSVELPDRVRIPRNSPRDAGRELKVLGAFPRLCPKCRRVVVRHVVLEDDYRYAECNPGCGFVLYRVAPDLSLEPPQFLVMALESLETLAEGNTEVLGWLALRRSKADPGPVYYEAGQVWTEQSEREAIVERAGAGAGAVQTCRVCGCTDEDCSRCIARTGMACDWVEDDLCSACSEDG